MTPDAVSYTHLDVYKRQICVMPRVRAAMAENGAAPPRNIPGLTPATRRRMRTAFRWLSVLSPALAARLALRLFTTPRSRSISTVDAGFLASAATRRLPTAHGEVQMYEWPGDGPAVLVLSLIHI